MKRLRSSPPQERHFSVIFTRQPVMDAAGLPGTDRPGALQAIRTIPLIMTVMTLWPIKQLGRR